MAAESALRTLRDGRLDGEHAPALAIEDSLDSPLGCFAFRHLVVSLLSQIASNKSQSRGIVLVALEKSAGFYLDLMRKTGIEEALLEKCVRILDCFSDPLDWKQRIQSELSVDKGEQPSTLKENVAVFSNLKDVDKLLSSIIDLGRGFQGEGRTYFSVAIDSVSCMSRHASLPWISGLLSNLRSHDEVSSIFWLIHSDLHEPKVSRAFECLSTMVASLEPVEQSIDGHGNSGGLTFVEQNYCKAKFSVRLKRRNGRVKLMFEELHVRGSGVKFCAAPSVSLAVNQSLLPKVQFNLQLSDKERSERANVVLPFEHQGKGEPIEIYDGRRSLLESEGETYLTTSSALADETKSTKSAKGEIHYIRDSDDEQADSDEDPDDDLDI